VREFEEVHYFSYAREQLDPPVADNFYLDANPGWHRWLYAFLMPVVQARTIRRCSVLRVMQATGAIPGRIARFLFRVPYVVTYGYHYGHFYLTEHGATASRWRAWLFDWRARSALRHADGVIVTTQALAEFARQYAPADRIALIPNSVDTERFSPAPEAVGSRPQRRLIAVGRVTSRKNHRLILEAAAGTGRRDIEVVIIGTGPEEDSLRRLAAESQIPLQLPGVVPNEELPQWLRSADIYLITSHHEGHPKSLLEAMSVGLPCIGADVKGIQDVLVNGETGWLCPPDSGALAEAISTLLTNKEKALAMGARARQFVLENYDARVVMAREIAFLKTVARRPRGRW
jgi:glycosyltransferase involved in cell wall biosynthesis